MSTPPLGATAPWERQTPDPARIRLILGGISLLGWALGALGSLLQLWSIDLRLEALGASGVVLALGLGSALPLLVGVPGSGSRSVQRYLVGGAALAAGSFLWLSQVLQAIWIVPPVAMLGVSLGGICLAVSLLLGASVSPPRSSAVIGMAGIFFCAGALSACVLSYLLRDIADITGLVALFAAPFGVFAGVSRRSPVFAHLRFELPVSRTWQFDASPGSVLLTLALFLESGIHWTVAGWLAFYLAHRFGMTSSDSLAILAVFWLAVTAGRLAVERFGASALTLRWLLYGCGSCIIGSLFLLQTADMSGAVMGALLTGGGLGVMHPLTLDSLAGRYPRIEQRPARAFFGTALSCGLLISGAAGRLASTMGIEIVIWTALGGGILVFIVLGVVLLESKLDERVSPTLS